MNTSGAMGDGDQAAPQLVITVHGIRTLGEWQERLERMLLEEPGERHVFNYKFGYFSVVAFLIPFTRWLVVRRFRKALRRQCAERTWSRVDIVAHSFGTHLTGWGLHGVRPDERLKVHTVILAGSVLRPDFPWGELIGRGVGRVVNECGTRDSILVMNQVAVLFTGMAGRVGFSGMTGKSLRNRFYDFRHSDYFLKDKVPDDTFMRENWVPLITGDGDIPECPDQRPSGPFDGIKRFLINNTEPLKVTVYLAPFVFLAITYYTLYQDERRSAREAEGARLIADAAAVRTDNPDLALLLAIEGAERYPSVEGNNALLGALHAGGHLTTLDGHVTPVITIAFDPEGRTVLTSCVDGSLRLFDSDTGELKHLIRAHTQRPTFAAIAPSGMYLVALSSTGGLTVHDVSTGRRLSTVPPSTVSGTFQMRVDDASVTGWGLPEGAPRRWRLPDGRAMDVDAVPESLAGVWLRLTPFERVALSPDGSWLVCNAADAAATLEVLDARSGRRITALAMQADRAKEIQFSLDGRWLGASTGESHAYVWATADFASPEVSQGAASAATKRVVSPAPRRRLGVLDQPTDHIALSADGRWFLTAPETRGDDGSRYVAPAQIWSLESGEAYFDIRVHDVATVPGRAVFHPDGQRVLIPTKDGRVLICPLQLLSAAKGAAPRPLEDWERLHHGLPTGGQP